MKTLKVLTAAVVIWGVAGVGVAQADPGNAGASHQSGGSSVTIRPSDTGWGPL
jgi:hypothetical protein